jgi:hypothetical protein
MDRSAPWFRSVPRRFGSLAIPLPAAAFVSLAVLPAPARPVTSASPRVVRSVPPEPQPNRALEAALREALFPVSIDAGEGYGRESRYTWNRVDLNGDGRPEMVAQVLGPTVCGTGGCPLLIFREPSDGDLQLICDR